MPSQTELTDGEKWGISLLTDLMSTGYKDPDTGEYHAPALKEPLSRDLAEERAYDIIVGAYLSERDKIAAAKSRYNTRKLGFEKCLQLAFNFSDKLSVHDVHEFVAKLLLTDWRQLKGGCFCVEFYSGEGSWNPHIHCWLPFCPAGQIRQLAKRKFASDKVNVWVGAGNRNLKDYVLGIKRDDKMGNVALDTEFRLANQFENVYHF
jgi:hypothetical protein